MYGNWFGIWSISELSFSLEFFVWLAHPHSACGVSFVPSKHPTATGLSTNMTQWKTNLPCADFPALTYIAENPSQCLLELNPWLALASFEERCGFPSGSVSVEKPENSTYSKATSCSVERNNSSMDACDFTVASRGGTLYPALLWASGRWHLWVLHPSWSR